MRQHSAPWLAAGVAALAIAAGCTREEPAEVRQEGAEAVDTAGNALSDGWITTKIQAKYFADADVKARNIDVNTNEGVVTLSGTVEDDKAREQALEIARATDGVVRVEDRLTAETAATTGVTPAPAADPTRPEPDRPAGTPGPEPDAEYSDRTQPAGDIGQGAWITTKIQAKYFADSVVKGRRIDVTTNNGVVTLTGKVESNSERQQALQLARETEGVRRVEDRLQIVAGDAAAPAGAGTPEYTGERATGDDPTLREQMSDTGITARVQSKFFLDDTVKGRNINVDTSGGTVTLEGEVRNELEREQAISLARSVDGVTDVQSRLQVNREAAGTTAGGAMSDMAGAVDDTWITTKIQSRYFMDDLVKGTRIDVTTENGVVTLAGQVQSDDAKQRAEALAEQTSGVSKVENKLTVGTEATTSTNPPAPLPVE